MRVTVAEWMVLDGEVRPVAGGCLWQVGVRLQCTELAASEQPGGTVRALPVGVEVHGTAGPAGDVLVDAGQGQARRVGCEFALEAPPYRFLVTTDASVATDAVEAGATVRVSGTLHVVAGYEWEGFDLPDLRTDWRVLSVARDAASGDLVVDLEPVTAAAG